MRNLFYDNMPAELRSEFMIGAEQYEFATIPLDERVKTSEVNLLAEQFLAKVEARLYSSTESESEELRRTR